MPNYSFDHIHLMVSNPIKAAEFYEKAFGAKRVALTTHANGVTSVALNLAGTTILIKSTPASDQRTTDLPQKRFGLEHWAIRTDDLDMTAKILKSMGIQFIQEITKLGPGLRMASIMTQDNVLVEIMEVKPAL